MTLETALACKGLFKAYKDVNRTVEVLKGIDLIVKPKERIAIVGRSGSGKTTLINCLGGIETPDQGTVTLGNINISSLSDRKRGHIRNRVLGLVFQFHHLLPEFSALENVCMPLLIRGTSVKHAVAAATQSLAAVELGHRLDHKPAALSGGERQRVAIARALVTSPKCVLADEPTGNLDHESAERVYQLMLRSSQERNTSFIIVTHDMELAGRMDRVVKLENGTLINLK